MRFESYISRRYLFSRERGALLAIITAISILGVAIGVCAMVVVFAVIDGMDQQIFKNMIDQQPHVIVRAKNRKPIADYESICKALRALSGVRGVSPAIERQAAYSRQWKDRETPAGVMILGIEPRNEDLVTRLEKRRLNGSVDLGGNEILITFKMAQEHSPSLSVGDSMDLLFKPTAGPQGLKWEKRTVKVAGIVSPATLDLETESALVNLETAQAMFGMASPPSVSTIRIAVLDPLAHLDNIKKEIASLASRSTDQALIVEGWDDLNKAIFSALKLERFGLFITLLLVIIVAGFNITGTQILIVMQKTRQIGVLMSLGADRPSVRRIFVGFGLIIGLVGSALGVAGGLTVCYILKYTSLVPIPAVLGISHFPVEFRPFTILIIVVSSMAVCTISALYPARKAAQLDPVEALRND